MESDTNQRQLTFISEQVQLCMLPALKENLDDVQLLPAHFESYHSLLRQELPKLYDVLQQNEHILFKDNSCQKVRLKLVHLKIYIHSFLIHLGAGRTRDTPLRIDGRFQIIHPGE